MSSDPLPSDRVLVSVIMANYNGAAFLETAIRSVLTQTLRDLELIVVDDASTDDSLAMVLELQRHDARIRVSRTDLNTGPGVARNRGLDLARGYWIAIVDSDDILHPRRFEWMVAAAERDNADIAADDLLLFDETGEQAPSALLALEEARWIDTARYVRSNALFSTRSAYGYLKPIFRVATTFAKGLRYNSGLRVAEDYDLVTRMMLSGARLRIYPRLTYFYRGHAASLSHRLSMQSLQAMLDEDIVCQRDSVTLPPLVARAFRLRRRSIVRAMAFTAMIDALKTGQFATAMRLVLANPRAALLFHQPMIARLRSLIPRAVRGSGPVAGGRDICLISRQRIVGNTNGSSVYLLDLCQTILKSGWRIHLICPSPLVFGRWPWLLPRPEMDRFASIRIRGGLRLGRLIVALDPRIAIVATVTALNRIANRLGLSRSTWVGPAPYAIGAAWKTRDFLYLARHARPRGDMVIADYAFLTDGFPYVLRPGSPTAVVMHDLFSSRASQFQQIGEGDSVSSLDLAREIPMLGQAAVVIAIQADESNVVRRRLPNTTVLTVPLSVAPVEKAQPGDAADILFIGSATAPNLIGLRWFIDHVWPSILEQVPDAVLLVAGGASKIVDGSAPRVTALGYVPDLPPLYRQASVVISPLLVGSGLKIKLIEAMAHGKAIVATPATLQGCGKEVRAAVTETADPVTFAAEVVVLLRDRALRESRGKVTLDLAARLFAREAAHAELITFLQNARPAPAATACPVLAREEVC
jgi:GT2 family glycosyltransferase/glycosyltransferase involved in cell wall biosynthesis